MAAQGRDKDRAATEAARWLVALEDAPDDVDLRARFETWLTASPDNAEAWTDTTDVYDLMAKTQPVHAAEWSGHAPVRAGAGNAGLDRATNVVPIGPQPSLRRRVALGMVAGALAACLALVVLPPIERSLQANYGTATGEMQSVSLDDGSMVRLGPDSAIAVDIADVERRVRLIRGEAFFEVARDPGRPFRVVAGEVTTTVLGTAFDVRLGGDGAAVAVRHGKVRVDHENAVPPVSERLGVGDWVRVAWDGRIERGSLPPDEVASWRQGQIVARDRRLDDVIDDLRRYYGGLIVLTDGALGRRRVTGVYNVGAPEAALRAMAGAHGGIVRQISPWVLVVSGG